VKHFKKAGNLTLQIAGNDEAEEVAQQVEAFNFNR
jgi:hypothetical protein